MKGILSAVEYMHDKGIVHRDLKPGKEIRSVTNFNFCYVDNILLQSKEDLSSCKVVDFGLSAKYKLADGGLDQKCGTVVYMAPEIITRNYEYTKSVDIWSTGIIMYEILTGGKHPLYIHNVDNVETYKKKLS